MKLSKYTFYIGSEKNRWGEIIPAESVTSRKVVTGDYLVGLFGGFTVTETYGGWENGAGDLVLERVLKFETLSKVAFIDPTKVAARLASIWNQEKVAWTEETVNGDF